MRGGNRVVDVTVNSEAGLMAFHESVAASSSHSKKRRQKMIGSIAVSSNALM
jgi:hypothetical protein